MRIDLLADCAIDLYEPNPHVVEIAERKIDGASEDTLIERTFKSN
jgi:hypothetical protein